MAIDGGAVNHVTATAIKPKMTPSGRMHIDSAYELLGYGRDEMPLEEDVQRRFRELQRRYHPDKVGDAAGNMAALLNEAKKTVLGGLQSGRPLATTSSRRHIVRSGGERAPAGSAPTVCDGTPNQECSSLKLPASSLVQTEAGSPLAREKMDAAFSVFREMAHSGHTSVGSARGFASGDAVPRGQQGGQRPQPPGREQSADTARTAEKSGMAMADTFAERDRERDEHLQRIAALEALLAAERCTCARLREQLSASNKACVHAELSADAHSAASPSSAPHHQALETKVGVLTERVAGLQRERRSLRQRYKALRALVQDVAAAMGQRSRAVLQALDRIEGLGADGKGWGAGVAEGVSSVRWEQSVLGTPARRVQRGEGDTPRLRAAVVVRGASPVMHGGEPI